MAALLAGARLVLRRGLRFLPAYTVRPAAVPVRCFSSSARFLVTAVQDKDTIDIKPVDLRGPMRLRSERSSLYSFGIGLKSTKRISRRHFFTTFNEVCAAGIPSSTQALFFLKACGSLMPGVPPSERTEIAETVWSKLQKLGVVFNESFYNVLLQVYNENEHKFSPIDFLSTMENAQLKPTQSTYEGLITAYCNEGDIEGASKILGFMKSNNLPITESVFSSLIRGHARSGDMESAKNILSVMEKAGLVPGTRACFALVCAYAEKGDIEGIKQTLQACTGKQTDKAFLSVIYCLAKAGHSQLVPDIFEFMQSCIGFQHELTNLCLMLLTQGYGDSALQVAKRFVTTDRSELEFTNQPGSFFIRHCIHLNKPASDLKKYAPELEESKLHSSPLQFAVYCALEDGNKALALDLLRTLKEEGLPVKPHYCWPLLATFHKENNVQGFLQVLKVMKELDVEPDLDTFHIYVADFFANIESPVSLLQENGFRKGFNQLYLSALKSGLLNKNLKPVYELLSSKIPLDKDTHFLHTLFYVFPRIGDVELMAKITKLLYQDSFSLQKPLRNTESFGYFLYGLIGSLSDSQVQDREEHLKQYFHQLKEMGARIDQQRAKGIIKFMKTRNVPVLIESINELVHSEPVDHEVKIVPDLEEQLETLKAGNLTHGHALKMLLYLIVDSKDLDKVLEFTSKHGSDFTFAMYMTVLGLCCTKNNPKEALRIREEVNRRGFTDLPSRTKYESLLKVLTQNGLIDDAINVLKEMQEKDVAVNDYILETLNTLAMKGDADSVHQLYEHIMLLGLAKPTPKLCSPLVMVHFQRNDPSAALDAMIKCNETLKFCPMEYVTLLNLVEMGETDLLKKAVDYLSDALGERSMLHALLFVFIESGNYVEAQKIAETPGLRAIQKKINWIIQRYVFLNKVEALEKSVEIAWNIYKIDREEMCFQLLCLYEKNKDWAKTIPLWHKMKDEGITLRNNTWALFTNIFKKNGQDISAHIPEFKEGRDQAQSNDSKRVIDLCKQGRSEDAYSLVLGCELNKKTLDRVAYARLIKALLKDRQLEDALNVEIIAKSHFNNYSMQSDSCNLLLAEQVRRDCLKDALVTVERLLNNGSMPGRVIMYRLTEAFAMKGDVDSLEKMEKMTSRSSITIAAMNKQYINTKLLAHFINENCEEATSMIESVCTENPQHSLSYLLFKLMRDSMSEALEKVTIVVERLSAQFSVYRPVTELFLVYLQLGRVEEATQLLQRCDAILEQDNILRPHIVRRGLMGQIVYVEQLLNLLNNPAYKQDGYNCLMNHYIATNKLDNALAMYERMKAEQIEPKEGYLKQLAILLRDADKPVPFPKPQDSVQSSSEEESYTSSPSDEKY